MNFPTASRSKIMALILPHTKKNLALNSTLYHVIKIVEEQGDSVIDSFKIALSDDGTWEYTASGFTLNSFQG